MALCYRDREFCSAPCLATSCDRNITPDVLEAATAWSASFGVRHALLARRDMSPHCPDFVSGVIPEPFVGLEPRYGGEPILNPTTEVLKDE